MVCLGLPYSCPLLRMCNAYAEIELFVFMCSICSRCLISIELPVWLTYDLLHVLHFNLLFHLSSFFLWRSIAQFIYMVLHVLNATFKFVLFNRLVTFVYEWNMMRKCDSFLSLFLYGSIFCFLCPDYFVP